MALRHSLSELVSSFAAIFKTRLELFVLEASNQKHELLHLVSMVLCAAFLLGLGLLVFTLALALLFWAGPYRYLVLFLLALLYLVGGGLLLWLVRRKLLLSPAPFAATLEELNSDLSMLNRLRGSSAAIGTGNNTENPHEPQP